MSKKTLKFSNIKINKKESHKSKQATDLDLVTTDKIVVSDKFKHSEKGYILLVIKKMKLSNHYVLYYLK